MSTSLFVRTQGACANITKEGYIRDWTSCSSTCYQTMLGLNSLCQGCPLRNPVSQDIALRSRAWRTAQARAARLVTNVH